MTFRPNISRRTWIVIAVLAAAGFFFIAISGDVYATTSPRHVAVRVFGSEAAQFGRPLGVSLHVVLRKLYSVVAFAIVTFAADKALGQSVHRTWRAVIFGASYSAAIEFAQYGFGNREGFASNTFDVLCGAAGGWLARWLTGRAPSGRRRAPD